MDTIVFTHWLVDFGFCITNGVQRSSSGTPTSRGEGQQTASSRGPNYANFKP